MIVIKRLTVWLIETLLELSLLGIYLAMLPGHNMHGLGKDILQYSIGMLFFFIPEYLLSTGVVRAIWRSRIWWYYSAIATTFFLVDFGMMKAFVVGTIFVPTDKPHFLVAGACITFTSTMAGTFALNKWVAA